MSTPRIETVYFMPERPSAHGLISPETPTVRRFSDAALQAQVDKVLAGLPANQNAAELSVGFDAQGVQVVGAVKLKRGWSLLGGVSYDPGASWGGRVAVRWAGH